MLMQDESWQWSRHGQRRAARRSISPAAIDKCLTFGMVIHQNGASVHHLTWRTAPLGTPEQWIGVVVVLSRDGHVITAYKCRKHLPRRLRRRIHSRSGAWPSWVKESA